jgi:hypothetical protein
MLSSVHLGTCSSVPPIRETATGASDLFGPDLIALAAARTRAYHFLVEHMFYEE